MRKLLKVVAINLAAVVVLVLTALGVAAWRLRTAPQWHAAVAMSGLDCSAGRVCTFPHERFVETTNAVGTVTRFHVNELGFRGPDIPVDEPDPKLVRVQVYGDSMVVGGGVDDGLEMTAQLEKVLAARFPKRRFEVQNFGMPMNYTTSNLRAYEAFGRAFRPDVVVFEFNPSPRDVNERIFEIRDSRILTWLVGFDDGRWLVNAWQVGLMADYSADRAAAALRAQLEPLVADERDRGLHVVFWDYWNDRDDDVPAVAPPGLAWTFIDSRLSMAQYRASPFVIVGDGHPTAAGHRFFAERIAAGLAPIVAALPERCCSATAAKSGER